MEMDEFLKAKSKYYGPQSPENNEFNENLQEFTLKVSYIVALETNGKLTPQEAYKRIKGLWKELKTSKKTLLSGSKEMEKEIDKQNKE